MDEEHGQRRDACSENPCFKGNSREGAGRSSGGGDSSDLDLLQKCIQTLKKKGVWQGIALTRGRSRFIVKLQFPHGSLTRDRSPMGSFGEDLRKERLARSFALEDISAVTKISQRHLIALEQEKFRLLPGGILSKGIVRGYANAIGLDPQEWTERFLQADDTGGQTADDDSGWTTFASNVGKARILHREALEERESEVVVGGRPEETSGAGVLTSERASANMPRRARAPWIFSPSGSLTTAMPPATRGQSGPSLPVLASLDALSQ